MGQKTHNNRPPLPINSIMFNISNDCKISNTNKIYINQVFILISKKYRTGHTHKETPPQKQKQ